MKTRDVPRTVDAITVSEVMTREVYTVTPESTVGDLIRLLSEEEITGVPVVTGTGRLRGVVSVTDVLRLAADGPIGTFQEEEAWEDAWDVLGRDGEASSTAPRSYFLDIGSHGMMLRPGAIDLPLLAFDQHRVADIMTPATFTVRPTATVRELARFLVRARIHRALVVDHGKLIGIVSAFDVVRAISGTA
jgi:CBS domain-containing protein